MDKDLQGTTRFRRLKQFRNSKIYKGQEDLDDQDLQGTGDLQDQDLHLSINQHFHIEGLDDPPPPPGCQKCEN